MALVDEVVCGAYVAPLQPLTECSGRMLVEDGRPAHGSPAARIDEVAFGPDNALAVTKGNPGDIFVAQTGCQVTNDPADDRSPSWAPVGFQGAESVPLR
jgi:hypothetical protein